MNHVASICKSSKQRGNALVLLLLLKTWDGPEEPDHFELAELANISPRQAERDLLKLVNDGDAERLSPEKHGGRGLKTRYRFKETTTHMSESDKTTTHLTQFTTKETPPEVTQIPETTTNMTGLSDVNPATSDVIIPANHDTSDGTPIAPSKDLRTSTDNTSHTQTARARKLPDLSPERQAEVAELHAYYCERIEPVTLDARAFGTLNRAIGEKGIAYCKKVIDGCALDDWPDRKFNNSIQFIFHDTERMGRLEKIARVKANEAGTKNQRSGNAGSTSGGARGSTGAHPVPARQWAVKARVGS